MGKKFRIDGPVQVFKQSYENKVYSNELNVKTV